MSKVTPKALPQELETQAIEAQKRPKKAVSMGRIISRTNQISSTWNRILHFITTFKWIDETKIAKKIHRNIEDFGELVANPEKIDAGDLNTIINKIGQMQIICRNLRHKMKDKEDNQSLKFKQELDVLKDQLCLLKKGAKLIKREWDLKSAGVEKLPEKFWSGEDRLKGKIAKYIKEAESRFGIKEALGDVLRNKLDRLCNSHFSDMFLKEIEETIDSIKQIVKQGIVWSNFILESECIFKTDNNKEVVEALKKDLELKEKELLSFENEIMSSLEALKAKREAIEKGKDEK